jgi:hypothetical protein
MWVVFPTIRQYQAETMLIFIFLFEILAYDFKKCIFDVYRIKELIINAQMKIYQES